MSRTRLQLGFLILAIAIASAMAYINVPTSPFGVYMQDTFYLAAVATSVALGIYTIWNIGLPSRLGGSLVLITIGLGFWFIGECIFIAYKIVGVDPFPSFADAFYIIAYVPLALGFARELRTFSSRLKIQNAVILFIVASLLISATLYFGAYKAFDPSGTLLENTFLIGYSIGDLLLVLLVLPAARLIYQYRSGVIARPWFWYLIGIVFTLAADILFGNFSVLYTSSSSFVNSIDLLWIAGYLSFAGGFLLHANALVGLRATNRVASRRLSAK